MPGPARADAASAGSGRAASCAKSPTGALSFFLSDLQLLTRRISTAQSSQPRQPALTPPCSARSPTRPTPLRFSKEKEDAAFALWEEAVLRFHRPEDGVNIAVGPQTCYAASPSLIRRGAELRKKHNLAGHIHLLETQGQARAQRARRLRATKTLASHFPSPPASCFALLFATALQRIPLLRL